MTSTRTLADLDPIYRAAEQRLTALVCGPQAKLTTWQHVVRAETIVQAFVDLRAIVAEMQLATYREPVMPMAVGMALRHALVALDADFWRRSAADWRREFEREQAAEKLAIMNAQRIEIDGEVVAP